MEYDAVNWLRQGRFLLSAMQFHSHYAYSWYPLGKKRTQAIQMLSNNHLGSTWSLRDGLPRLHK
jgi:hypothetical protein